jgi:hypothetical protein
LVQTKGSADGMDVNSRTSPASPTVEIDGIGWAPVATFAESGPEDRHFMASVDPVSGATSIRFGDGANGKRPATAIALVSASYRSGAGSAGDVQGDANAPLRTLLEVIRDQFEDLEADLERLYADWFVPGTNSWVIPCAGDGPVEEEWTFSRADGRRCLCLEPARDRHRGD